MICPNQAARIGAAQGESAGQFTIRFRRRGRAGRIALLIEDHRGSIYLYCGGSLQMRWSGRDARRRLRRLVRDIRDWTPVPKVAPYSIEELRSLTGA